MEKCRICELRDKDVINICDGKRLGFISDVIVDVSSGCVSAVVVLGDGRAFRIGKCEEFVIPWDRICCFGKDTVLVKVDPPLYNKSKSEKSSEKN